MVEIRLLSNVKNHEECDATKVATTTAAWPIKFPLYFLYSYAV